MIYFRPNRLKQKARRTYLMTYSQADLNKVPTRESFANLVVLGFTNGKQEQKAQPLHWACCLEEHANEGKHYHLSLKFSQPARWKSAQSSVADLTGVVLHFSSAHDNY